MNKSIFFKLVTISFIILIVACDKNPTGVESPKLQKNEEIPKTRTMESIRTIIMQNLESIRDAYNDRLEEKPELSGKMMCKFAINELGEVVFCQVTESTINDPQLEQIVVEIINQWNFGEIDNPGDITEVIYPFEFSTFI